MDKIEIFPNQEILSRAVSKEIILRANHAIETKGSFSVALAGGSSPKRTYQLLATPDNANSINWSKVHLFWGDERNVPPENIESNYHMVKVALLDRINIPPSNVHRIEGEMNAKIAAHRYQQVLHNFFDEIPRFDLILLGMGTDGHTASLFPGTKALGKSSDWVTENYLENSSTWRITLTYPVLNQASTIIFMVSGDEKADSLHQVLNGEFQPDLYPAQGVRPIHGDLYWYVDQNAAKFLKSNIDYSGPNKGKK